MKAKVIVDMPCTKCHRVKVEHYAKGMCRNCYHNSYYHEHVKNAPKDSEESKLSTS